MIFRSLGTLPDIARWVAGETVDPPVSCNAACMQRTAPLHCDLIFAFSGNQIAEYRSGTHIAGISTA